VTLVVTRINISCRVVRHMNILVSREHRLSLTGSRWDIRWLSGRGRTLTLCVFPVITVAVMEKCCDARGDREYYFRSGCSTSQDACLSAASIVVNRKSMRRTVVERSLKDADFVLI
jgi:hypothetical protein